MSDWPPQQPIEHGWPESESLIKRVAKALEALDDAASDPCEWPSYEEKARAAIAAMRDPPMNMLDAGRVYGQGFAGSTWNAMIREALK